MTANPIQSWRFTSPGGDFFLQDPHHTNYLYFPLVNEAGMMSVVTPTLHGDAKTGQHTYVLPPVSVEDLHASRYNRNFWVSTDGGVLWSAAGNSGAQIASSEDAVTLEAGFLWHKVTRENTRIGLRAEITNFVPSAPDHVELMRVTLTNIGGQPISLLPTAAIPIYARSADNLRDHRNVTSMLHRIRCEQYGISVKPTLSFDERGHRLNTMAYIVLGAEGEGTAPVGFFPVLEDFIGEGGALDWPAAVRDVAIQPCLAGCVVAGYEAMGGLRFRPVDLHPGESRSYVIILAVLPDGGETTNLVSLYGSDARFNLAWEKTVDYWRARLAALSFHTGDPDFNAWSKWVTLQPILRRLFGNSFLPYHDYGRGGRGWRDLWQDILISLLMEKDSSDNLLFGNFAGVRLDGSNATIIGNRPGEFKADRNNIPRVWMDHGAWPLITTQLYIDQTGDLEFLLRAQTYFKDGYSHRCTEIDPEWEESQGTAQRTLHGLVFIGSIFEHLLVQHLTAFFNVGDHNNILLEGADWNDGMDMARQKGESVAFTSLYASNLVRLSRLALDLQARGVTQLEIFTELLPLLDTLGQSVDYDSPMAKRARLNAYFDSVRNTVSGHKAALPISQVAGDLKDKADWMIAHIRKNEWLENSAGFGWFNGYYDNDGARVEGDHPQGVRMTLTGQVFSLMGGIATEEQARQQLRAAKRYLFDERLRGYRLNTDFGEVMLHMGRCFGYAYGHKENGAMFSHMAVMYAYALYERGFIREGYQLLADIYRQSVDFPTSRMYPGIPEYFNNRGRGMYPYLTGSASWYLLTLVTRAFGLYGIRGELALEPKLVGEQFDRSGEAGLAILFAGRRLEVTYLNPARLDYGAYRVGAIALDGRPAPVHNQNGVAILPRAAITALDDANPHRLVIHLGKK